MLQLFSLDFALWGSGPDENTALGLVKHMFSNFSAIHCRENTVISSRDHSEEMSSLSYNPFAVDTDSSKFINS